MSTKLKKMDQMGGEWRDIILGEKTGTWGHLWEELETQCNKNYQPSMRVILAKTPSNGGFRARNGHLE